MFVPVSGPGGAGEYFRALAIARAVELRWPSARIVCVLSRTAAYASQTRFPVLWTDDSPTRSSRQVITHIAAERPDVVVFDSSGRMAQYRAARAAGAGVVYVSSRPKTRWKGFRWRRMRVLDQHWLANPAFLGGQPTAWETFKVKVAGRPELLQLDPLYEDIDAPGTRALQRSLRLVPGRYVVVCPGGGGTFGSGPDAARLFVAAARALAHDTDVPVLALVGTRLAGDASLRAECPHNLTMLDSVPNGILIGLLRDAAVALVNGGSLLLQAMAQNVPIVAAPIAGDQVARIRRCARAGYVREAALDERAIATASRCLLNDAASQSALRARLRELDLHNGAASAADAIERLLVRKPRP
jgi:hypothetical protein